MARLGHLLSTPAPKLCTLLVMRSMYSYFDSFPNRSINFIGKLPSQTIPPSPLESCVKGAYFHSPAPQHPSALSSAPAAQLSLPAHPLPASANSLSKLCTRPKWLSANRSQIDLYSALLRTQNSSARFLTLFHSETTNSFYSTPALTIVPSHIVSACNKNTAAIPGAWPSPLHDNTLNPLDLIRCKLALSRTFLLPRVVVHFLSALPPCLRPIFPSSLLSARSFLCDC